LTQAVPKCVKPRGGVEGMSMNSGARMVGPKRPSVRPTLVVGP